MTASRFRATVVLLCCVTLLLFHFSLVIGPAGMGTGESLRALLGGGKELQVLVMQEIRLPRALLGLVVGATLGLSGGALQGFLRNPLAEPGLIGISASASLGAVIAIYTGLSALFALALPLLALVGAMLAVIVLRAMAGPDGRPLAVILTGVAISSFAAAMTSLVLNLSPNPFAATEIVFWMLGSLTDRSMTHVWLILPFTLIGWFMLFRLGRALDALSLGPDAAASMGIDMRHAQRLVILGTALSVGAATAVTGAIGFIGLVVPHVLRPFVGAQPSRLLPASALGGASLLLAADILVRVVAPERDLKLGVVTAIVGAPFFLWLVWSYRRTAL
ncbi:iron ABC transporter permease [Shinella daejeonensis]|uniref:FecCD family ABC transporter permease n=1 Tax=Shinella daejeonensis TaxID=659017 RepID=UPI0020C75F29|nr:iron ABC transporter permease [Shinella daejeonensis]MCP8895142.1 iron ABC transporter permease [Shinella daejeonensis]